MQEVGVSICGAKVLGPEIEKSQRDVLESD